MYVRLWLLADLWPGRDPGPLSPRYRHRGVPDLTTSKGLNILPHVFLKAGEVSMTLNPYGGCFRRAQKALGVIAEKQRDGWWWRFS